MTDLFPTIHLLLYLLLLNGLSFNESPTKKKFTSIRGEDSPLTMVLGRCRDVSALQEDIAKLLIGFGASLKSDSFDSSPLRLACEQGKKEIVAALLDVDPL